MKRKWQLIIGLVLTLVLTGGGYAFTYLSATATMDVTVAGAEIATYELSAAQPPWSSILVPPAAGTETLRPSAPGDETLISDQEPDSGAHWEKVDDEIPDGDSTYVSTENFDWQEDLYNIADHSIGSGTINYVKVYMVCRAEITNPSQSTAYVHIKTGGMEYNGGDDTMTDSYATYSYQWSANPQTGEAWTWDEIDALQIGVGLRRPKPNTYIRCTQVYAEVNYGGGIALCGEVPTGNLFDITPHTDYTADLAVKVYLTNTGDLIKAYQYLNMKLHLPGSVEADETPNYQLLTLDNGEATFNMKDYAPGTYTLSVTGGSYCLVSTDTGQWEEGATVIPEFYCQIVQR